MDGSSSAPTFPSNFAQLHLSSRNSTSFSSLIQNANMVTPEEGELPKTQTVAMEGWSSAPPLPIDSITHLSSGPGSFSSSLLQSVNMVTPPERELSGKDTVAMEGWSSAPPPLLDFTPLLCSCHGSSSSSSPAQNANAVTPQGRDLLGKDTVAMEGSNSAPPLPFDFTKLQLGCPGSSFSSSPTQNANVVTSQELGLPGTQTVAMEGSSSAPPLPFDFTKLQLGCPGSSSSSSLTQNANAGRDLLGKDTVAMEGSSSAPPLPFDFTKLQLGCPGSSSSSSPTQNANAGRDLLGKDTVAMEGSNSAPPLPFDFTKLQLGCPGSSFTSSPTRNANGVTTQQRDLQGKGLKRKRSSGNVVPNNNGRPVPRNNEEENHYAGKCKIKKKLTKSDLSDRLSRLMLSRSRVEADVLPLMDEEMKEQVKSRNGMKVVVRNADTHEEHELVFRRWGPSGSYVLNCGWTKLFVKGRGLEVGDEIGMFWDTDDRKFHFAVHRKVGRGTSNAVA